MREGLIEARIAESACREFAERAARRLAARFGTVGRYTLRPAPDLRQIVESGTVREIAEAAGRIYPRLEGGFVPWGRWVGCIPRCAARKVRPKKWIIAGESHNREKAHAGARKLQKGGPLWGHFSMSETSQAKFRVFISHKLKASRK